MKVTKTELKKLVSEAVKKTLGGSAPKAAPAVAPKEVKKVIKEEKSTMRITRKQLDETIKLHVKRKLLEMDMTAMDETPEEESMDETNMNATTTYSTRNKEMDETISFDVGMGEEADSATGSGASVPSMAGNMAPGMGEMGKPGMPGHDPKPGMPMAPQLDQHGMEVPGSEGDEFDRGMGEMPHAQGAPMSMEQLPTETELDGVGEWDMELESGDEIVFEYAMKVAGIRPRRLVSGRSIHEALVALVNAPSPAQLSEAAEDKVAGLLTKWGYTYDKPIQEAAQKLARSLLVQLGFEYK